MSKLIFRYRFDASDDFGWLEVEISTEKFSGRGGFWVQWQDVREFGESLSRYPISADTPIKGEWGYDTLKDDDVVLSIEISPDNPRGDLRVKAEIADHYEPAKRVRTSFVTNYPDIENFRVAIAKLMERQSDEAVLLGR